jgi:hypothetical protein
VQEGGTRVLRNSMYRLRRKVADEKTSLNTRWSFARDPLRELNVPRSADFPHHHQNVLARANRT